MSDIVHSLSEVCLVFHGPLDVWISLLHVHSVPDQGLDHPQRPHLEGQLDGGSLVLLIVQVEVSSSLNQGVNALHYLQVVHPSMLLASLHQKSIFLVYINSAEKFALYTVNDRFSGQNSQALFVL